VQRRSGIDQNIVAADPPPNYVRFVCQDLGSVFECRPTVPRERDLPDANCTLDATHAQSGRERGRVLLERRDEHGEHREKGPLLLTRQPPELAVKAGEPLERRHGYPF